MFKTSIFLMVCFTITSSNNERDISGITVRFERLNCYCGKYCTVKNCNVKFISRSIANGNAFGILKREATAVKLKIKSYFQFSNNQYRPMGFDTTFDFCAIQAGLSSSPLHAAMMYVLGNHTNINRNCPLPPDEYYVKNLNFQARHLPNINPAGRHLINVTGYIQSNIWLHNVSIYFSVTNYGPDYRTMGGSMGPRRQLT